jgi:hypothetical protein
MYKLLSMAQEIVEAIKALGADDNKSNRQALVTVLELHASTADDLYLRRGLSRIAIMLKAHEGG